MNFVIGIKNLIRWFPIIWYDRDWDWYFLALILETKLRFMSDHAKNHWLAKDSDKSASQLLICAELLKRIKEDDIFEMDHKKHERRMKGWEEMFAGYFTKYLRTWWD